MTQAAAARIDSISNIPAALALHQRPAVPGVRSTFGTMSELLNSLRLMYSRLGSHLCPNGHHLPPSPDVALDRRLTCPVCGAVFDPPSAESFSFNSDGACRTCGGTGVVRAVDESTLVPDDSLTIDQGAVAPWNSLMWSLMVDVCREMGVRTDVPFRDLTSREKEIVLPRPRRQKAHPLQGQEFQPGRRAGLHLLQRGVYGGKNALSKVKDDKGMKRVEKFLKQSPCPDCGGTRLCARARSTLLRGISLPEASAMTLDALTGWVAAVPGEMPPPMQEMAASIAIPVPKHCPPPAGPGPGLSGPGPGRQHPFHRRAAAGTAGPGGAQPEHRRAVCAGRTFHRAASRQCGGPAGGHPGPDKPRQHRRSGGA